MEKEKVCAGEREGQRKENRVGFAFLVAFRSVVVWTVGKDDDVEEESTMRHGCNKRDEHLDSPHSAAPHRPTAARLLQTLRHSDPGHWISPQARGNFSHKTPCTST